MEKNLNKPEISIVLGSYNRYRFLKKTIESIRSNGIEIPYEIVVIDGGSTDGSINWLIKQKDVITIVQHNHGTWQGHPVFRRSWGYFMNKAFRSCNGKYIVMISDDCLLAPKALQSAYELFEDKISKGNKIGALAFYWRNWPEMDHYWIVKIYGEFYNVNHGMYLRNVLDEVGWIDEESYLFYCADYDLSLKIYESGYKIEISKQSFVEHFSHANIKARKSHNSVFDHDVEVFNQKWSHLKSTPLYNKLEEYERINSESNSELCKSFIYLAPCFFAKWKVQETVVKIVPKRIIKIVPKSVKQIVYKIISPQ